MRLIIALLTALLITTSANAGDWDDYWSPGGIRDQQQAQSSFESSLSAKVQKSIRQGKSTVMYDNKGRPYVTGTYNIMPGTGPNVSGNSVRWNNLPSVDFRTSFEDRAAAARGHAISNGDTWSRSGGGRSNANTMF